MAYFKECTCQLPQALKKLTRLGNVEAKFKQLCNFIGVSSYNTNWAGIYERYPISVSKYIERTWLCYKDRFIIAWTKAYRYLGNAASNRAEGQHEAAKSRIAVSTGYPADVYSRTLLAVYHQDKVIRHIIAYSRAHTLIALSGDIWADVRRKISHHALKKAHEEVMKSRISPSTPCTNVFTSTIRIPCLHRVRDILATRVRFQKEFFFVQWWLDRNEKTCHEDTTDLTLEQALSQIPDRFYKLPPH